MRIFFGATLPEITKDEIAELVSSLRLSLRNARFEGRDKLHITFQFIGDFSADRAGELFESASSGLAKLPPMASVTEIVGLSYFPNNRVRRGVWLECRDDGTLARVSQVIKEASSSYGIAPDAREFKPHITIARMSQPFDARGRRGDTRGAFDRSGPMFPEDLQKLLGGGKLSVDRFFPKSVALFESTLKPSGSEYRILYEYSLEKSENEITRQGTSDGKGI
jgi:2'-5' RNA ligase